MTDSAICVASASPCALGNNARPVVQSTHSIRHRRRATGLATDISYILEHELTLRGIPFEAQKRLAVVYKGQIIGEYIADLVIDGKIIPSTKLRASLELKAVSKLTPAHEAQAHHYITATGLRLALLINFGASSLEQRRIIR